MKFQSGHQATVLEGEEWERQKSHWLGYTEGLVRFSPGGWVFPTTFTKFADKYYNFEVIYRWLYFPPSSFTYNVFKYECMLIASYRRRIIFAMLLFPPVQANRCVGAYLG